MLRVSKFHRSPLIIDDEPVKLRFVKLGVTEYSEFAQEFQRLGKVSTGTALDLKPRPGEEDLTADEIQAKRYFELPAEARAAAEAAEREESARGNQFAVDAITAYVTAEPGQIFDEDENREITSGEDLVKHFGARPDVLRDLVGEIFLVNRLSEADKKKLQLLRASMRSSSERKATGGALDATAASAAPSTSAASGPATDVPRRDPSGSTDPSA